MVGSQTINLTPNFVLGYNVYFTSPNEKCKFIFLYLHFEFFMIYKTLDLEQVYPCKFDPMIWDIPNSQSKNSSQKSEECFLFTPLMYLGLFLPEVYS
jgi:hypothetical protein